MQMIVEKHQVRNVELFELAFAGRNGLPEEVARFLADAQWPWAALGKNLTRFVEECVGKVPAGERIRGKVSPLAHIEDPDAVVICEGAEVEPHAYIAGPTWIGPGAVVRHGAYVRGSVYACAKSVIGHTTEAKGSLLLPGAKAAHFAYVGDSILGIDVNLGAGTKLANLRLDSGLVRVLVAGERIDSGLKKFGAVFGNRAQSGCNSVTNPGTILLPGAFVLPNSTSTGVIRGRG
jgi:NDP-sugar pyrophosphorylase family protein